MTTEREALTEAFKILAKHGWTPCKVWDGGEHPEDVKSSEEALDAVFAVDMADVRFCHANFVATHVLVIVLGNEPHEVINDSSMGPHWDDAMQEVDAYLATLEPT